MDEKILTEVEKAKEIEGFPIGELEDIIGISDPPYFTAYPNPHLEEFIDEFGKLYNPDEDNYSRTPFITDIQEGKNDPIYNAHTYHTKVPWKAVAKFIEHYTEPGDIVFDGFCGTGMAGVAAKMTGRHAILCDLCPSATFIAHNFCHPPDPGEFKKEAERILKEVEEECGWMYETYHKIERVGKKVKGKINYVVWSDVFSCPNCGAELIFWDVAVDKEGGKVKRTFNCSSCDIELDKRKLERVFEKIYGSALGKEIERAKQVPVLINYSVGKKRYEKVPDEDDLKLIEEIEGQDIPYWYPTYRMPEGDESRRNDPYGITHVHHFYTKRNLWMLAAIHDRIVSTKEAQHTLLSWFTSQLVNVSFLNRFRFNVSYPYNPLSGTLYVSSMVKESNVLVAYENKTKKFLRAVKAAQFAKETFSYISTQSMTDFQNLSSDSIDYIFVDPPFGGNLMYSELNFLWEAWLRVFTNNREEAIINKTQKKSLEEYKGLMYTCFKEMYRVLKPNRWITVEFHNSKAAVWNAIQNALSKAGFIIAMVTTLDKKAKTFKQITAPGAVDTDLIINAYKPKKVFEEKFLKVAGRGFEKYFVEEHLSHLSLEPNIERTEHMLYSRMLSYYVQHGYEIVMDSAEFYDMLMKNFINIDDFWYTVEQASEIKSKTPEWVSGAIKTERGQVKLIITSEKDAILWLWNFLGEPKTYGEIYIEYTKMLSDTKGDILELKQLLDENFIFENEKYRRPTGNERIEIERRKKAKMIREFYKLLEEIKSAKTKGKVTWANRDSIVEGFKDLYSEKKFEDILEVAEKLPLKFIEENGDISQYVDIAKMKQGLI